MVLKRSTGIIMTVVMLLMSCFISVGYAAISDRLEMRGSVSVSMPEGLFISGIKVQGTTDVDHQSVSFIPYTTTVESIIDKKNDTTTTSGGNSWWPNWGQTTTTTTYAGTVTYEITVYNNTKYEYAYRGLYYQTSEYNNSKVSTSPSDSALGVETSFPNGSLVASRGKLVFYVTYTVGKSLDDEGDWKTLLNYQFGINVDSIDKAADIVHQKFLNILNTTSTYEQLVDVLDDKFDGAQEWTSNYVGNVGNAVDNDMMTVETPFAGHLTMMVNGKPQKAWVIIKHENLDGNEMTGDDYTVRFNQYGDITYKGCEMTLYMTVDKLETANSWAPVYATVFTCNRDESGNIVGGWYKVGDSYYGEANVVGYNGEYGATGSFVTDNWKSYSSTYQVTKDYSYSIGAEISIKTLMQTVDQSTINEFQSLLTRAKAMIENQKYAGTGITVVEDAYAAAAPYYTIDGNGVAVANGEGTTNTASVNADNHDKASFTINDFKGAGDVATFTFTIVNVGDVAASITPKLNATLGNTNTEYFEISSDWNGATKTLPAKTGDTPGSITYTVTVKMIKTPTETISGSFLIELNAVSATPTNP